MVELELVRIVVCSIDHKLRLRFGTLKEIMNAEGREEVDGNSRDNIEGFRVDHFDFIRVVEESEAGVWESHGFLALCDYHT